jgi:trehalose 6-phosphate phosphatase
MSRRADELPDARTDAGLRHRLSSEPFALFLDYDGTLTPIVARPELAVLDAAMRSALRRLAAHTTVAILSGRDLADVRAMVDTEGLWFAGSHGFDVAAPDGTRTEIEEARAHRNALRRAADDLDRAVASIPGAWVERKRFADAVHFRQVDDDLVPVLEAAVDRVAVAHPGLRRTGGKMIFELRPDIDWDKGRALWSVFDRAGLRRGAVLPVFIGDDLTDEDAFAALDAKGVGIVVADDDRLTEASYRLDDAAAVQAFLDDVASLRGEERRT